MRMIVYSQSDPAGKNIAAHLRRAMQFAEVPLGESPHTAWRMGDSLLIETTARLIDLDLDTMGAEWILCLSRHRSESGKRCLTTHTPGNLTAQADLGGRPTQVGISNPPLQARLLLGLKAEKDRLGIPEEVTVEATHHGPTSLPCPVTFVEIGSDEEAWLDGRLGQCVAQAVVRALEDQGTAPPSAIGVGGGHYSGKFTSLMLEGRYSIGHIIPKYAMTAGMPTAMFSTCMGRTLGGVTAAVVDWKGTPSVYKEYLKASAAPLGIDLVRI